MRAYGQRRKIAYASVQGVIIAWMKKSTRKLTIRRETLRALAQLDLVQVAGGNPDAPRLGTDNPETGCPLQAAAPPKQ